MVIENCLLTHKNSVVLKNCMMEVSSTRYLTGQQYHTGIDIEADTVYAICAGVCTYVGYSTEEKHVVLLQYDSNTSFRYCNLDAVNVRKGQVIDNEARIGHADKYIHFEVITTEYSNWCVRVGNKDYYKHDPTNYLLNNTEYEHSGSVENFYFSNIDEELQTEF